MAATAIVTPMGSRLLNPLGSFSRKHGVVQPAEALGMALPFPSEGRQSHPQTRIMAPVSAPPALLFCSPLRWASKHEGRGISVCATVAVSSAVQNEKEESTVPLPVVHIINEYDPEATVVEISFGDRLGALLDTAKALKNLGLNVVKAKVFTEDDGKHVFHITRQDTGYKVESPELLESVRLTILNNLLKYHPESSEQLALGAFFGTKPPKAPLDVDVATHIHCEKVNDKQSVLTVETADRPGLLLEIIHVMNDISVVVESAEIDTEGLVAKDKFFVSYGGSALSKSLEQVLVNCLRYYIRRPLTEEDSY